MKKAFVILFFLAGIFANAQVNFRKVGFDDLIKMAQEEKKLIYVDAYTDWCGWCKELDKKTFTDSAVSAFMNAHFVCSKMEMEKDVWGKKIAAKYVVNSFPDGLIFDENGNLVYDISGYSEPKDFIKYLEKAIIKDNQYNLKGYSKSFDLEYPEFYKNAMDVNGKRVFPKKKEINSYLLKQKDAFCETSWVVWKRFAYQLDELNTNFLLYNFYSFADLYGRPAVEDIVGSIIYTALDSAGKTKNEALLNYTLNMADKYMSEPENYKAWLKMNYYEKTKNWVEYAKGVNERIESGSIFSNNSINDASWKIYKNCKDNAVIKQAVAWMGKVIIAEPSCAFLDTYAALLYKDNQLGQAEKYAVQAIEKGKLQKEDVKETEILLKKIKAKK